MLAFERIAEVLSAGRPAVLVTLVSSQGSTPRKQGARMLVYADGSSEGSVGGGALELRATELARARVGDDEASLVELNLLSELGILQPMKSTSCPLAPKRMWSLPPISTVTMRAVWAVF